MPETIATVVHELKTPLTSMVGYARLLRTGWNRMSEARRDDCFDVIEQQAERLARMLEDLLNAARLSHDPPALRRRRVDLPGMLAGIVKELTAVEPAERFRVTVPDEELHLYGDESALRHALTNLVENAVKYSPAGTPIDIVVRARAGEIAIDVANDGPGIARSDLPFVFDRFRRGGATQAPGSGLGLYIVKSLVEAHDGAVSVVSRPDARTVFSVVLPRRA